MRYMIYTCMLVFIFISGDVYAVGQAPFASDFYNKIKNYNRASTFVATSGVLYPETTIMELAQHGIRTIIDLRTENEGTGVAAEKKLVEERMMTYINIPITGEGITKEQLAVFTKEFENAEKPVLIHCVSGNRAGAMLTSYYLSQGMESEMAFERGRTAGMKSDLEKKIRENCDSC